MVHIKRMGKGYAGAVYAVAASKNGKIEYWVAASRSKQATAAVQLLLGPTWSVKLSDHRLTPPQLAELNLRPDEVRRLSAIGKMLGIRRNSLTIVVTGTSIIGVQSHEDKDGGPSRS